MKFLVKLFTVICVLIFSPVSFAENTESIDQIMRDIEDQGASVEAERMFTPVFEHFDRDMYRTAEYLKSVGYYCAYPSIQEKETTFRIVCGKLTCRSKFRFFRRGWRSTGIEFNTTASPLFERRGKYRVGVVNYSLSRCLSDDETRKRERWLVTRSNGIMREF